MLTHAVGIAEKQCSTCAKIPWQIRTKRRVIRPDRDLIGHNCIYG
jgi:hypothetical protein